MAIKLTTDQPRPKTTARPQSQPKSKSPTPGPTNPAAANPTSEPNSKASKKSKKVKKPKTPRTTKQKMLLAALIFVSVLLVASIIAIVYLLITHKAEIDKVKRAEFSEPVYSLLTGEEIASSDLLSSPTYCVQIPNGTDGARPQAGLNQAGVVFEAIAERGITRFAAIFQNANASAIGPIRSLRPYYLEWDTPFDCTVVHAGGSDEALAEISAGGQRNLDESIEYMWRENSARNWNNLFTSSAEIANFNNAHSYNTSELKAFPRYTPEENENLVSENLTCTSETVSDGEETDTTTECTPEAPVADIAINFGASPIFNTNYHYDLETNRYLRSYANGNPHTSYECPLVLTEPNTLADCGEPVQLSPSIVIAMFVNEQTAADNYHENIPTVTDGTAVIFQNGIAIEANWSKTSVDHQITFKDSAGATIKFAPGQLWIAAVPQYGSIDY